MKYLTALVWLSLAVAPQAVLAADSPPVETASADFTATIELPGDEAPLLEFTGNLAWLKPKLRVELINPVSQETTIALIDLESLQFIAHILRRDNPCAGFNRYRSQNDRIETGWNVGVDTGRGLVPDCLYH